MAEDKINAAPVAPKKGAWETASMRIGVLSGGLGLLVAVLGLPDKIMGAFGGSAPDPAVAAQIEQSRPILEVKYVLLSDDLLGWRGSMAAPDDTTAQAQPERSAVARTLLSLPIVMTDAATPGDSTPVVGDDINLFSHTAFLFIENRGKRDATDIAVHADQLSFNAPPEVREDGGAEDYVTQLRRQARETSVVSIRVPRPLAPGEAVLVPVFVSAAPWGRFARWWVTSPSALLPDSLTFLDPVIERRRSAAVRRMVNPTLVERGIMDRG